MPPLLGTSVSIPLNSLPLRPSTLEQLQQRGFSNTSEIAKARQDGGLANLAAELGCSLRQATDYFRELQGCITAITSQGKNNSSNAVGTNHPQLQPELQHHTPLSGAKTAAQILSQNTTSSSRMKPRNLVTFCRSIDNLLGGGIAIGEVTEIAGSPGCGKTQLAMQLSVDARLPTDYGGVAGETCYIDTEGNFSPERCHTMAHALVDHVRKSAERKRRSSRGGNRPSPPVPDWFEPDTILQGIHVFRAHDEAAQTAIIQALPEFLRQRARNGCPVKLLVVDSIAFHYRCSPPGGNFMARTRSLASVAALLSDIATSFEMAVVVINQMTTKFGTTNPTTGNNSTESRLVPALGESWAHATTTRLIISTAPSQKRVCNLVKSPHRPCGVATFEVLECGIRDCDTPDYHHGRQHLADRTSKRIRAN